MASLQDELIAKELALLTFEVRQSADALKALLSESFKEIGASGAYFDRNCVVEHLPREQNWSGTAQNFEFRLLSDDVAQLIYEGVVTSHRNSEPVYSRRTSIWRRETEGWKMVYHQGTPTSSFNIST